MNQTKFSKSGKTINGLFAAMILVVVLFSSFYIAYEADHNCTGKDCSVCTCIQKCENTLRQIGNGIAAGISAVIPVLRILFTAFLITFIFSQETLVSQKIRLNN